MFVARLPALYYNYDNMSDRNTWTSYDNATLLISLSVVPIASYAQYWSVSFLLFEKEFTACPGKYVHSLSLCVSRSRSGCHYNSHNAIHDPTISLVAMSTVLEGALDVLSCSTLMTLASNQLPGQVNGAIVLFCLLELLNGCQSFALQGILSGGHEDTPQHLIHWKAQLRGIRGLIDLGTFVLRLVLWIQYNAVSSVFLIKNLYNLLHTVVEVERAYGTAVYPKGTLFTEFVPPQDWYGLTQAQWRVATSETLTAQARAGRRV